MYLRPDLARSRSTTDGPAPAVARVLRPRGRRIGGAALAAVAAVTFAGPGITGATPASAAISGCRSGQTCISSDAGVLTARRSADLPKVSFITDKASAHKLDRPFSFTRADGDRISVTIKKSGTVTIRAVEPTRTSVPGTLVINGLAPEEARTITKAWYDRAWSWIKGAYRALVKALTFDGGPYLGSCRADVQVTHVDGQPVGGTVGISCDH